MAGPFDVDRSPICSIVIGGNEYENVSEFSYESNLLTLGDAFGVSLPNPFGKMNKKVERGDLVEFFVQDPDVNGGEKNRKLKGRVTQRRGISRAQQGTVVEVAGQDLGWHLVNTDAPMWFRLRGATFDRLLTEVLEGAWEFSGIRFDNDFNRKKKLNQGRAGVVQQITPTFKAFIPPIQTDVGQKIADLLITYAKRERKLINVSADGYLQIFAPNYKQDAKYIFHHHRADEDESSKNNVKGAVLEESIDTVYSHVTCVTTVVRPPSTTDAKNPNEGRIRGTFLPDVAPLPFPRRITFSDGDQFGKEKANARAKWMWERGMFDATTYTIEVKGFSQGGWFFEPDTIAEVHDTMHGLEGKMYVVGVKLRRDRREGTVASITMKLPDLLSA